MKSTIIFVLTFLLPSLNLAGQNNIIHGRVLSEDLEPLPGLHINNSDTVLLGKTDIDGRFKISIPKEVDSLLLSALNMEWTQIKLKKDCESVEIIIMYLGLYHYKSSNKIDRFRKKRFDKLVELHSNAVQEGFFEKKELCYERDFEPIKPDLDRIRKDLNALKKEKVNEFKDLQIGETVKIPLGFDSSGKRVNTYYSICGYCTEDDYDYVIEGEIVNKYRKNLTLEIKVLRMLPHDFIEYEEKTLKINSTFNYQMKYFDVILN